MTSRRTDESAVERIYGRKKGGMHKMTEGRPDRKIGLVDDGISLTDEQTKRRKVRVTDTQRQTDRRERDREKREWERDRCRETDREKRETERIDGAGGRDRHRQTQRQTQIRRQTQVHTQTQREERRERQ